jgi:hypothetical protein
MGDETKTRASGVWLIITVMVLPLAYLLSFGPVAGFAQRYHFSKMDSCCRQFYAPIVWLHQNTPLKSLIEAYARCWGVR